MIHGTERDLIVLLILMKLIKLDIYFSNMSNQWIINQIHQVIMDIWILFLLKMATSGRLIQICRADFLFDHLITGFGLIGNKCRQHSIKNKLDFNEIKRMGAGPHPSAPYVTKEL